MTAQISDKLYNHGLSRAKGGNMSGAIENLKKSVDTNRNNVAARNLLGLIYFETGRIGDALKHWVISASIMRENNLAVEYLERVQKDSRTLERFDDAVKMYNGALEYLRQKSDDMAIIQLKKAIEINPGFIDAMNLLALCCLIQKDREKAQSLVEKTLAIDSGNEIALRYYKELFPTKIRPEPVNIVKKRPAAGTQTHNFSAIMPKDKRSFGDSFHIAEIISFIIGGVCVLAIAYYLVVPGIVQAKDASFEKLRADLNAEIVANESKISSYETREGEMSAEIERLQAENTEYSRQVSLQRRLVKIDEAYRLFDDGDAVGAADALVILDTADMPAEAVQRVADMKIQAYPVAAEQLYNDAVQNYNMENYDEASALIEKCLVFIDASAGYMDGVLYHKALLAEHAGDIDTAKQYFGTVIDDFTNSQYRSRANNRLNALTEEE
jgi:tetratricopeptide (TPR) repeat protein